MARLLYPRAAAAVMAVVVVTATVMLTHDDDGIRLPNQGARRSVDRQSCGGLLSCSAVTMQSLRGRPYTGVGSMPPRFC